MGEFQVIMRILLADSSPDFARTVNMILQERSNGVRFELTCHHDPQAEIPQGFDVYILDQSFIGFEELVKTIKKIQKGQDGVKIIIVGDTSNATVLKNIMKAGIRCFVDKTDEDLEPIFDEIREESENKYRVLKIRDGLRKLDAERCRLDNALRAIG